MRTSPLGAAPMSGGTRGSSQRELVAVTAHEGVRGGSQYAGSSPSPAAPVPGRARASRRAVASRWAAAVRGRDEGFELMRVSLAPVLFMKG